QDLMRRFPTFRLPPHYAAVVQPDGGFLEAEPSVQLMLTLATQGGAVVRSGESVRIVEPHQRGVRVTTDRTTIDAGVAIIAAGPPCIAAGPGVMPLLPE